jgi:hypothetical protein
MFAERTFLGINCKFVWLWQCWKLNNPSDVRTRLCQHLSRNKTHAAYEYTPKFRLEEYSRQKLCCCDVNILLVRTFFMNMIEQVNIMVKFYKCIWKILVRTSAGIPATLTENFRAFPQFVQANAEIVPRLDYGGYLPNHLPFISQPTIRCYIIFFSHAHISCVSRSHLQQLRARTKHMNNRQFLSRSCHDPVACR